MGNEDNTTQETLSYVTSNLEGISDPRIIANVAIGAIMVLCKRLMYKEVENEVE